MNSNFLNNKQHGFTLIEVLISMAILVFISFAIYQATIETYKLREILTTEGDFYNVIRLSTAILQRDLSLLYSPVMAQPDPDKNKGYPPNPPTLAPGLPDDLFQTYTYWTASVDASGLRPSHFIGTDSKLSFISASHIRIYRDSPESEFAKIKYELKRDEKNRDHPDTMVLVKTESPNAFAPDDFKDEMSHSYEILHGVKKLSFSYLKRDGNTWKTSQSWDSDKEENKNAYPDMIEMKIEIVGPKKQIFEGDYKFRPEIPLSGINPST